MKRLVFVICFAFVSSLALNGRYGLDISYFIWKGTPTPNSPTPPTTAEIFMDEDCSLPCLLDLNVGTDSLNDVLNWIEDFPQELTYDRINVDNEYKILYTDFVISNLSTETPEYIVLGFWINKQTKTLAAIQIYIETSQPQYWEPYMPNNFVNKYGEPDKQNLQAIISASMSPTFSFVIQYEMGLYVEYHGFLENMESSDTSTTEVCITEKTTSILLWFQPPSTSASAIWNETVFGEDVGEDWKSVAIELAAEDLEELYKKASCFSSELIRE